MAVGDATGAAVGRAVTTVTGVLVTFTVAVGEDATRAVWVGVAATGEPLTTDGVPEATTVTVSDVAEGVPVTVDGVSEGGAVGCAVTTGGLVASAA